MCWHLKLGLDEDLESERGILNWEKLNPRLKINQGLKFKIST